MRGAYIKMNVTISKRMLLYQNAYKRYHPCSEIPPGGVPHLSQLLIVLTSYIKMHTTISKCIHCVHGRVINALGIFFLKKGMTCHNY